MELSSQCQVTAVFNLHLHGDFLIALSPMASAINSFLRGLGALEDRLG
jgi:hypothetical protein